MRNKNIPVYHLTDFKQFESGRDFYANTLQDHLQTHHFIHAPHRHDFFITILFAKGSGTHEIDFKFYDVKPGTIFFLSPGQMHDWKLSDNCEGYIFFHSAAFYNLYFMSKKIKDYPFFASLYNQPYLYLKPSEKTALAQKFNTLLHEYKGNGLMKNALLCNMADSIYIELTRLYPSLSTKENVSAGYLSKLATFEQLTNTEFRTLKLPKDYAGRLHLSEKHLNRICQECLGKTTSEVITDKIIMEAKRLLITSGLPVSQIAEELGYSDHAYFSRFFRKKCGQTPLKFVKGYKG